MLILPYTDAFRINFNQLSQRILQAAADGHRTPHRNIIISKFLAGHLEAE